MMRKVIKCGLIGGLVLFIWSAIFWMVFACHNKYMMSFSDERDVASVIVDNAPKSGIYILPCPNSKDPEQMKKFEEKMTQGPFVYAAVKLEGKNPHMGGSMLASFILKAAAACLVTWLLIQARALEFRKAVKFVTVVGVVVGILVAFPHAIWFGFPAGYVVCSLIDTIVGWFLAGVAIAKFVK